MMHMKCEEECSLEVTKELPASEAEKADAFNKAVKPLLEGIKGCKINVSAKLGPGDPYKAITKVTPLKEEESVDLDHKDGQVWLIDFWATWCGPCQTPMTHNQEMLTKRSAEWGENVRFLGISIDQTKEPVVKRVEDKGWTSIEHYMRDKSDCSDVYEVRGIPHVMLIDKKGKIAFKGHPA
jgi:thiol-disulfide isomerase/thioredoxin